MGVGTGGGNEWIRGLTPELRSNVPENLAPAVGAPVVADAVEELGEAPWAWCVAIASEMTQMIFDQVPELPEEVFEEARTSSEANVLAILETLMYADRQPALPPAAVEFTRRSVRRGIPLNAILHGYRLGHRFLVHELQGTITSLTAGPALESVQRALDASFRYVDMGVEQLVSEYESEREHWARTAAARRAETIHAILAGEPFDASNAGAVLGYPLERRHLAVIVWRRTGAELSASRLEEGALVLASQVSNVQPLLISLGEDVVWMWAIPRDGPLPNLSLDGESLRAAVGVPGNGAEGFRRSHEMAQSVARIARLSGDRAPALLTWEEVGLLSLATADLDGARAFVRGELGDLAAPDAKDLRHTLRAFLANRGSHAAAARVLFVHRNTVAYRLTQAEELLGHPIADRELELRVALEIAETLGDAALPGVDP